MRHLLHTIAFVFMLSASYSALANPQLLNSVELAHKLDLQNNSSLEIIHLANGGISEGQAASIAKSAYGGSVMGVSRREGVYHVKLLKDGHVRIVKVDANSGNIL